MKNKKPQIKCPYCHVFSQMEVFEHKFQEDLDSRGGMPYFSSTQEIRRCSNCGGKFFYLDGKLKYPEPEVIAPATDMPEDVKKLYDEAASICYRSPRAACALLRLAIEILCNNLGATGDTIDAKISTLVRRGVTEDIQQALDVVRVVGNNAVHPGQIAFDVDDESTAMMLFNLINIIVRRLISEPATINTLYGKLPESAKTHVAKRDKA